MIHHLTSNGTAVKLCSRSQANFTVFPGQQTTEASFTAGPGQQLTHITTVYELQIASFHSWSEPSTSQLYRWFWPTHYKLYYFCRDNKWQVLRLWLSSSQLCRVFRDKDRQALRNTPAYQQASVAAGPKHSLSTFTVSANHKSLYSWFGTTND